MLLIPISVLIATLVTFGSLEKTAQVTAFKSCGISVYRLALPVISVAGLISVSIFVLQDYVLPYANQRQDNLRNLIKGRPIQTFYQPGHNWIFGKDNRLFNYNYFDSKRGLFGELSIYEMNIRENQLVRHLYAQRAQWDRVAWKWHLYDGWDRDLQKESEGYTPFEQLDVALPETPDYFVQEVKESSKMTYIELDQYVRELQQRGFEVDHLKTELYTKVSFPLVSFVMVVLGIPFAFSVGKKGALYGVAIGALIGIVYWGTFGVFGVLGGNGLLSPLLAAWGPNLIFGSGSLFLFLGVKT
jgi:LPS export ABC transporter permease LptG